MTHIEYNRKTCKYSDLLKIITISEKHVVFDTAYRIWNPETKHGKVFNFSHSTGPEFDPNTKWIYKSDDGLTLEVVNDAEITQKRADLYFNAKMRN